MRKDTQSLEVALKLYTNFMTIEEKVIQNHNHIVSHCKPTFKGFQCQNKLNSRMHKKGNDCTSISIVPTSIRSIVRSYNPFDMHDAKVINKMINYPYLNKQSRCYLLSTCIFKVTIIMECEIHSCCQNTWKWKYSTNDRGFQ